MFEQTMGRNSDTHSWFKGMVGQLPHGGKSRLADAMGLRNDQVSKILSYDRGFRNDELQKAEAFFNSENDKSSARQSIAAKQDSINIGDDISGDTTDELHIDNIDREIWAQAYQRAKVQIAEGFPSALSPREEARLAKWNYYEIIKENSKV